MTGRVGLDAAAWAPHGAALRDYLNGDTGAEVVVRDEAGEAECVAAQVFFREPEEFSALEDVALDLCGGRVLDVGAGAGSHCLALQDRGVSVVALDLAEEAVEVMRCRGVNEAHRGDIFNWDGEQFDTLLLLMNGVGVVGTLEGLDRFLQVAQRLLLPGGQILLDSYDMRDAEPARGAADSPAHANRYVGEMRFQLEYAGVCGPFYPWLFVDYPTLAARAAQAGFLCEGVWHEEEGHYLARLTRTEWAG